MSALRPRRVGAVVLRHFYLIRGSLSRVAPLFAGVAVDMVLWGFMTRDLNTVTSAGFNFVPVLLGAVLCWDFLTRVMQGVTMAFFEDVWARNFLNVFATPISIAEYLGGLVLASVGTSAIGLAVMLAVAVALFGLSFAPLGLLLVPFLAVLVLFGIALGIFGTALVLRLGPAAEWFVWPVPAILSPFAAVFYPVSTLPGWMQTVARLLPPSYVFEGMRAVLAHRAFSEITLAWGAVLAVAYVVLACRFFARVHRYAVRTGLIARYSAESVS